MQKIFFLPCQETSGPAEHLQFAMTLLDAMHFTMKLVARRVIHK